MNKLSKKVTNQGFTLIEILVVIGIIAVLAAVVLIAINPARQFAQARDSQRVANTNAILNAIGQNIADNVGIFSCNDVAFDLPDDVEIIENANADADLGPCLVPDYIPALPFDPAAASAEWNTVNDYDTQYTVELVEGQRVQVCTRDIAETEEEALERDEPICVTR